MDSVYETYTRNRPIMGFRSGFYNNLVAPVNKNGKIRLLYTDATDFNIHKDDKAKADSIVEWYYSDYDWINRQFDLMGKVKVKDIDTYIGFLDKMILEDTRWSNGVK